MKEATLDTARLLACMIAVSSLSVAPAGAAAEVLQAKHLAQLRSVSQAEISPDGELIAYTLSVPHELLGEKDGAGWEELHVVDREGHSRPFITGRERIGGIDWSADGSHITYVAKRGDDKHAALYRIPVDGGESRRVHAHPGDISGARANADGSRILYVAAPEKSEDRKTLEKQGFNHVVYEEDRVPQQLWLLTPDADEEAVPLNVPGSVRGARWHPDGRHAAVVATPTPSVDDGYIRPRLLILDTRENRVIQEIERSGKLGALAFSPDGKYLALVAGEDIHDPMDGRLMVVSLDAEDAAPTDLMPGFEGHVTSLAWQDNTTISWVAAVGTGSLLGSVDLTGKVTHLADDGPVLGNLSRASDGALAFVGHSAGHPGEVFSVRPGEPPARLTNSNPWLDAIALGDQETVTWRARDGLELQGVLVRPTGYEAGRRYPLIMVVHGGPEANYSDGWVTWYASPGQLAAGSGFMVFYPNYRGSTGRGVAFSKLGQGAAAAAEFDDLVDAVDHLVEAGLVDRDRVGITGSSYGGYASAWGATFLSEHFAASVVHVGISDKVSFSGTTDIPDEMFYSHDTVRPWDDWDYFWTSSPVRYVKRNRTPTLILHGAKDTRVHPSQALELYRQLKALDQAPVRLVMYPNEGHGSKRAAARLDHSLRLMRWMEHFLKDRAEGLPPYDIDYANSLGREDEEEKGGSDSKD